MNIKPENFTLDKLLQGRLFRISDYQRTYSWETKQRKDLFQDILKLARHADSERHHFMSTIVCLRTGKKEELGADEFDIFSIVDGQQRITTLIILLKVLSEELLQGDDSERKQGNKLQELLVKEESERLILLQTNHDGKHFFRNYLQDANIPPESIIITSADKNMVSAVYECRKFVKEEWNESLINLLKLLKNRLDFIFYVLEDEGAVHNTFEVLNSRGLDVDWLDKCKSMIMGIAFENLDSNTKAERSEDLCHYWSKIYQAIGLKKVSGAEILKFATTLELEETPSTFLTPEKYISFVRSRCEKDIKYILEISKKFLEVAVVLKEIDSDVRIKAISKISHARFLNLSIKVNPHFTEEQKRIFLKRWENITFRIFGLCRRDARTKKGEYIRLACKLSKLKLNKNYDSDYVVNEMEKLGHGDYSLEKAVSELSHENCYDKWTDELIYFFRCYEEYLCKKLGSITNLESWQHIWNTSSSTSIEHIHPQNISSKAWKGKIKDQKSSLEQQIHRLGNLIILPPNVNSKIQDKSFQEKKKVYEQHRQLKLLDEIIQEKDWNLEAIN